LGEACQQTPSGRFRDYDRESAIGAVPGVGLVVGGRAQNGAFGLPRVLLAAGVVGG
jgi:hypothetical protein